MKIKDEVLLRIYKKRGMNDTQAEAMLKRVRSLPPVDPGMTPPCIENAADDSYLANGGQMV